jgi:cob(I)alamin adenosyltransferase
MKQGLVQVYTGDGKGKTTASLGLAFRAAGHGYKTRIIQFMKGQIKYGELKAAKLLPGLVEVVQAGRKEFVSRENPAPVDVRMAQAAIGLAKAELEKDQVDILVLDEINCALDYKLVTLEQVLGLIKAKPPKMELVLTGRNAHPKVKAAADLVTEMKLVKHYWQKGVAGRKGIEF